MNGKQSDNAALLVQVMGNLAAAEKATAASIRRYFELKDDADQQRTKGLAVVFAKRKEAAEAAAESLRIEAEIERAYQVEMATALSVLEQTAEDSAESGAVIATIADQNANIRRLPPRKAKAD
jgi:hypothetical protein